MKVLNLPFTKKNSIVQSDLNQYLLMLPFSDMVANHLDTVHGAASFALAESTSGYFLNLHFAEIAEETVPVLRSACIKYKQKASGNLYATASFTTHTVEEIHQQLQSRRKAFFTIQVTIVNTDHQPVAVGDFEWFASMK